MTKAISFSIDKSNFDASPRREDAVVDSTTNPSNNGVAQNCLTQREARHLADFVVALARNRVYFFTRASRNQTQGRCLQLGKGHFTIAA